MIVPAKLIVPLPQEVPWEQGAPVTDAGMTSMHALRKGGVTQGTRVGIIGAGGLGSLAIQFALGMGAEVYVAEINEKAHNAIREFGDIKIAASITAFTGDNLDVIVDYAGFGTTTAEALETVRVGGTIVQVGLGTEHATISSQAMVLKQLHYFGSLGGTPEDVAEVLELLATARVKIQRRHS